MLNKFQELLENFKNLNQEESPQENILEKGTKTLKQWLENYAVTLNNWGKVGEVNGTMMQFFHWYIPSDGSHWNH